MKYSSALPGERFGRLIVIAIIDGRTRRCLCDCGKESQVLRCNLKTGNTTSCGCYRTEVEKVCSITHGASSDKHWTQAYTAWHGMKQRCHNPKNLVYKNYGERGISVCKEWINSFETFLSDMGNPPDEYSINRIDNDGPYSKANCEWSNETDQQRNKRSNRVLEFNGVKKPLSEWAEVVGIPYYTLHTRLRRGWSVADVLSKEVQTNVL